MKWHKAPLVANAYYAQRARATVAKLYGAGLLVGPGQFDNIRQRVQL
jgi:hypothetical protein